MPTAPPNTAPAIAGIDQAITDPWQAKHKDDGSKVGALKLKVGSGGAARSGTHQMPQGPQYRQINKSDRACQGV